MSDKNLRYCLQLIFDMIYLVIISVIIDIHFGDHVGLAALLTLMYIRSPGYKKDEE